MKRIFSMIMVVISIIALSACANESQESVKTEYLVVAARYTSIESGLIFKDFKETVEITYINGNKEYVSFSVDPEYGQIVIGEENKVIVYDENTFYKYEECILTAETYNKMVSSSPQVIKIEEGKQK